MLLCCGAPTTPSAGTSRDCPKATTSPAALQNTVRLVASQTASLGGNTRSRRQVVVLWLVFTALTTLNRLQFRASRYLLTDERESQCATTRSAPSAKWTACNVG